MSEPNPSAEPSKKKARGYRATPISTTWEMADIAIRLAALSGSSEPNLDLAIELMVAARGKIAARQREEEINYYDFLDRAIEAQNNPIPKPPHESEIQAICEVIESKMSFPIKLDDVTREAFSFGGRRMQDKKRRDAKLAAALKQHGKPMLPAEYFVQSYPELYDLVSILAPSLPSIAKAGKASQKTVKRHGYKDNMSGKFKRLSVKRCKES